jgi:hypothetical protein
MFTVELPYDYGTFVKVPSKEEKDKEICCIVTGYTISEDELLILVTGYTNLFIGGYLETEITVMTEEEIEEIKNINESIIYTHGGENYYKIIFSNDISDVLEHTIYKLIHENEDSVYDMFMSSDIVYIYTDYPFVNENDICFSSDFESRDDILYLGKMTKIN